MNPLPRRSFLGLSLGLLGTTTLLEETTVAAAPAAGGAMKEELVKFKKPEIAAIKAPDYQLKGGTEKRFKPSDWMEIEFELEVKLPKGSPPKTKFIDGLDIKFFVFLDLADKTKLKVLTATVNYINVPAGGNDKEHVVVYLSPATLLHLTEEKTVNKQMVTGIGAEASYSGVVVGRFSAGLGAPGQPWWTSPKMPPTEEGRLLPKHKTPFAPLWYDYYLEEKAEK